MKEMQYKNFYQVAVLDYGNYRGIKYVILSCGLYPLAYVEDQLGVEDLNDDRLPKNFLELPHGGFSMCGTCEVLSELEELSGLNVDVIKWFGWDYNHIHDYCGNINYAKDFSPKKWQTTEILQCVKRVIDKMIEIKNSNPNIWAEKRYQLNINADVYVKVIPAENENHFARVPYVYGSLKTLKALLKNLNKQIHIIEKAEDNEQKAKEDSVREEYVPENLLED